VGSALLFRVIYIMSFDEVLSVIIVRWSIYSVWLHLFTNNHVQRASGITIGIE
jgi:hypothetical protein